MQMPCRLSHSAWHLFRRSNSADVYWTSGAPEEIRTPDPQIRSLLLNQGSPLLCSSRSAARMEPHRDGGPAAPHDCFQRLHSWRSMFGGQSHFLFALFGQSRRGRAILCILLPRRYSLYAGRQECFRSVQITRSADPFAPSAELIAFRPV